MTNLNARNINIKELFGEHVVRMFAGMNATDRAEAVTLYRTRSLQDFIEIYMLDPLMTEGFKTYGKIVEA